MLKSNKSFKRPSSNDGIDRISNLPEPLISEILSLLPIESAVATSVLSTRWKLLWTSLTSLNFDEDKICLWALPEEHSNMMRTKFTQFVNRVLFLITPPLIQKFRFECAKHLLDPFYLSLWITAIAPTVQELDLTICIFKLQKNMVFPLRDFQFNKLVGLSLDGAVDFNIPAQSSVCFPSLQSLYLIDIKFSVASNSSVSFPNLKMLLMCDIVSANEEPIHKLCSSCPILEDLDVSTKDWKSLPTLIFLVGSLTRLTLDFWGDYDPPNDVQIHKLHKLEYLSISCHAPQAIVTASANISLDFHNLKRLVLDAYDCSEWSVGIKQLLESMDYLEHLVFKRTEIGCSQKFGTPCWTETLNVPECLKSRVTTISFTQMMDDCNNELELIRYLLKNAKVLQMFKICTESISLDRKFQLIQKISMFPRGSEACQVKFT